MYNGELFPWVLCFCWAHAWALLAESFFSVFTSEKALNENCVIENMAEQINEFTVEKEKVVQQLNSLNIH